MFQKNRVQKHFIFQTPPPPRSQIPSCGKILQKEHLFCNLPSRVNMRFCAGGNFWEAKIIIFSFSGKLWLGRLNIKFAAAIKLWRILAPRLD